MSNEQLARGLFVTGTDTDCGKTVVTLGLMRALALAGWRVGGFKPVAAGAQVTESGLCNDDALAIQSLCDPAEPYSVVNPFCFEPPIAPHIAAAEVETQISLPPILQALQALRSRHDWLVVEGAGGWRVPLAQEFDLAGLAAAMELPVLLVVPLRLGCLNHAFLTQESIQSAGLTLLGWVANGVQPQMARRSENMQALRAGLSAPCIGEIPNMNRIDIDLVARQLDVSRLSA